METFSPSGASLRLLTPSGDQRLPRDGGHPRSGSAPAASRGESPAVALGVIRPVCGASRPWLMGGRAG